MTWSRYRPDTRNRVIFFQIEIKYFFNLLEMEVCVDSLESAINAYKGQATRIELCSSLNEGGLTPSYGLLKSVKKYLENADRKFGIYCMIRCRAGDFNYSDSELDVMFEDLKKFVELGVDGLVFGSLDQVGHIDESAIRQFFKLIPADSKIETTFHRAFDVCDDWKTCFETIKSFGFNRLLTSGQKKSAFEGRQLIAQLVKQANNNSTNSAPIIVMPGAGINSSNLEQLLNETACTEFHASCRTSRCSNMVYRNTEVPMGSTHNLESEFIINYTNWEKVKELSDIYKKVRI